MQDEGCAYFTHISASLFMHSNRPSKLGKA